MNTADFFSQATARTLNLLSKVIGRKAASAAVHGLLVLVILVLLIVFVTQQTDPQQRAILAKEAEKRAASETKKRAAATAELTLHFSNSGLETRIEPDGNSITVYVTKGQFESIPFPDRKGFIQKAGSLWCPGQDGLMPSMVLSDIRSGERLGKYSCMTRRATMP